MNEVLISFCIDRKLSSYLITATMQPIERIVGFFKYKVARYQTCLNVNKTYAFNSTTTEKTK